MTWTPRTRAEIFDDGASDHEARADAAARPVDLREGAPWERLWRALALVLESQEAGLDALADEILPDTATTSFLDRHGGVEGMAREPATRAVLYHEFLGAPSATITFGSATLTAPNGEVYTPSKFADGTGPSVILDGAGIGHLHATARAAGTDGNQPDGTVFTWSAVPTDANPDTFVVSTYAAAVDEEEDGPYALRVLARRQERPASGNRADWREWTIAVDGVDDAVVYPLLDAALGTETPGAVTVVPLGPAQGDSPTNTRLISGGLAATVAGYVEGANDAAGAALVDGAQLRPVAMVAGAYYVEPAAETADDVTVDVTLAAAYAAPFAYDPALTVEASPAPTTTTFSLPGDVTATLAPAGAPVAILVNVDPAVYRGGYYKVTPTSVTYNGGTAQTDVVVPALPGAPAGGEEVLPGLPSWADMRAAIFTLFDGLGPGDTSPACRWPGEETRLRSTLYRSALVAALVAQYDDRGALHCGVAGVLDVAVATPAADVVPPAKTIATLATLKIRPA